MSSASPSSSMMAPTKEGTSELYHPMFKNEDADYILCSNDGVRFKTYTLVLRNSSQFFSDMFLLPPTRPTTSSLTLDILRLDDDAATIERVLRMISALPILPFESLDEVEGLLHFCEKYSMPGPISIIQAGVSRPELLLEPLRLYKLACRYNWPEEAQLAATLSLKYDLTDTVSTTALLGIDFIHYTRLLSLRGRRRDTFSTIINNPAVFSGSDPAHKCSKCGLQANDLTWKILRLVLVSEFEKCPGGDTIRGEGFHTWPEVLACWEAAHCGVKLYTPRATRAKILDCLEGLPKELIVTEEPV